ncbi:MAG: adenosylcobinamide-phosphate synthase CbiB [Xenococcaceae cyanobacterium MO_207.B15]|nr:adenosylcobinamide-phosphate synthase CbiB [Xenococcaceae cyanobacterium MO_207.B15]
MIALLSAAIWDYLIGDPDSWIHPVQLMGWIIQGCSQFVIQVTAQKSLRRIAGVILGLALILGSSCVGWLIIKGANIIHPWLGTGIEIMLLASCFAGKSLRVAAEAVLDTLKEADLVKARSQLSRYVGRDTENLSETEILRAILETVAENATDGVTAPLFYAIVGLFLPGVGSLPLALGYKAASTLDSMIGYRREPYSDIGWFSAQLEDRLTWIPCRLTVLTLAIFSGKPRQVLAICRRDAIVDPSPNSGWSECVYGAILGVQLGGVNTYGGVVKKKPLLGNGDRPITAEIIYEALKLTRYCFLSWLLLATCYLLMVNWGDLR